MGSPVGDLGFPKEGESDATAKADQKGPAPKITQDQGEEPSEEIQNSRAALLASVTRILELQSRKDALTLKLEAALQARKKTLVQIEELEVMRSRLRARELSLENAKVSIQEISEDVAITKGKLLPSARSLLSAANALEAAQSRLQDASQHSKQWVDTDACMLLAGAGGHGKLTHLQDMLSARRGLLVAQIAALYPIVPCSTSLVSQPKHLANTDSASRECNDVLMEKVETLPMTIGGLHVVVPLNMKPGLYNASNDLEASATALGYGAHALSLLAHYLDVPLRYPIRFGGSRSYIQDHAPAVEAIASEAGLNVMDAYLGGNRKTIAEFPLFSEGQDSTRSAYAVFLLNKDLEQVLNYMGSESVGPRHTLPNLNKIIQLVCFGASGAM